MLLTKSNAALSLLFNLKLLDHRDTVVLFGSDFPGDRTDTQVFQGDSSDSPRASFCACFEYRVLGTL